MSGGKTGHCGRHLSAGFGPCEPAAHMHWSLEKKANARSLHIMRRPRLCPDRRGVLIHGSGQRLRVDETRPFHSGQDPQHFPRTRAGCYPQLSPLLGAEGTLKAFLPNGPRVTRQGPPGNNCGLTGGQPPEKLRLPGLSALGAGVQGC